MAMTLHYRTPADEPVDRSLIEKRAPSVAHLFRSRVEASANEVAYSFPRGDAWVPVTWKEAREQAYRLAAGLIALGVGPEERVSIASTTRYEWAICDLAIMCAGAATTTIYPTTIPGDVSYILSNSDSRVVFAEDDAQIAKLREVRHEIPHVTRVVTYDGTPDGDWVITLDELDQMGAELLATQSGAVDDRIDALTPERLATIIYTSGTTGRPKGVRLTHDAWVYEGAAVDSIGILTPEDSQFLWLPLSHVLGKVLLTIPMQIGFPTAIDGRVDKIVENLGVVKPTFMGAPPRIFEKAKGRISMMMEEEGGIKYRLFRWAEGVGAKAAAARAEGRAPSGLLGLQHSLADKLVLGKVRERFGGRVRFFVSGSAALDPAIAQWFDAFGILILEGYGLTETSAFSFVNRPKAYSHGTVGWPAPGTEVRIAEDGEVLVRGPGVMEGYHNAQDQTAETVDVQGWLHTGDIGEVDERGFLKITDRKKDMFKTSGGKYVAPSRIESTFKGMCPYVSQMLVHGADRHFVSALVTLDPDAMEGWAAANNMAGKSYSEVVTSQRCRDMVQTYIDELNLTLNRWEQIKRFTILDKDFSVEEGEITPSMKLRRKVVNERYRGQLDAHYADTPVK
jgi:long-chain acyl-CoA synthetase